MEPETPRDLLWEEAIVKELQKHGESQGASLSSYTLNRARRRLAEGESRYGNSFRNRDILAAARKKAADIVAYSLLEAQKRNEAGTDGHHYLYQACVHAMMVEEFLALSKQYE
jgi:hypothetical protein